MAKQSDFEFVGQKLLLCVVEPQSGVGMTLAIDLHRFQRRATGFEKEACRRTMVGHVMAFFVHRDGWRSIVDPYNHNSERWLDGGGASRERKIPR